MTNSPESTKPDETPASIGEKSPPSSKPDETPAPMSEKSPPPPSKPGKGSRRGAIVVLILIVAAWPGISFPIA